MKKLISLLIVFLTFLSVNANHEKFPRKENIHRIMSYNIRNAIGMDEVTNYERTANVIRSINPDVVAVQEIDSVTGRSQQVDVLNRIADLTKMYACYGSAISFQGGKYGIGILSKEKPLSCEKISLPGREEARALLIAEFDDYVFCCTHLSLTEEDRNASVDMINKAVAKYKKPVFLAGDLNAEPASELIKRLSSDWKVLNNIKQPTFPADDPKETIDYILGRTAGGKIYSVHQSRVIGENVAFDHRPLFVDVRLKADADKVMRTRPYLQKPSTNGMTVMWLTNVPCRSWVEYGTDVKNMKRARSFIEGEMIANNTINKIHLEGLKPGTKYYYRAVSQEITLYQPYRKEFGDTVYSEMQTFTTFDDGKKDFTMLIFNDIHKNYSLFDKLKDLVKDVPYEMIVFNGDCIDDAQTEGDIVNTISYYGDRIGNDRVPSVYLRGNHETRGEYSVPLWNYLERQGDNTTYAAFNLGDTRIVLMDCGEDKPDDHWVYYDMNDFTKYRQDQAEFLRKEINSKEFKSASKRVLIHHIPIYGTNIDEYNPCLELWGPIFSKADFNVGINAHTHQYEFIPKGKYQNNFPVVIGGGNKENSATVMILQKQDKKMSLRVLNVKGEELLKLDL